MNSTYSLNKNKFIYNNYSPTMLANIMTFNYKIIIYNIIILDNKHFLL